MTNIDNHKEAEPKYPKRIPYGMMNFLSVDSSDISWHRYGGVRGDKRNRNN